jgi:hypothetical protein
MPEELRTDRRQTDMEHEMQTEELPGRPDAESSVFVAVTSVDICTQQPLGFSLGFRDIWVTRSTWTVSTQRAWLRPCR